MMLVTEVAIMLVTEVAIMLVTEVAIMQLSWQSLHCFLQAPAQMVIRNICRILQDTSTKCYQKSVSVLASHQCPASAECLMSHLPVAQILKQICVSCRAVCCMTDSS